LKPIYNKGFIVINGNVDDNLFKKKLAERKVKIKNYRTDNFHNISSHKTKK